jgi:hypothetical protein
MSRIFDLQALREVTGGDATLEKDLLERFRGTVTRCVDQGVSMKPAAAWPPLLHELRGAAGAMQAGALTDFCQLGEEHPPASSTEQSRYKSDLRQLALETLTTITKALAPR